MDEFPSVPCPFEKNLQNSFYSSLTRRGEKRSFHGGLLFQISLIERVGTGASEEGSHKPTTLIIQIDSDFFNR